MATEKYGVNARLLESLASTPVDTSTNVVFIGVARIDRLEGYPVQGTNESEAAFGKRLREFIDARLDRPILITSMADFEQKLNGKLESTNPSDLEDESQFVTLLDAAKAAFNVAGLSRCWMINVWDPTDCDHEEVSASIVAGVADSMTGVHALHRLFPEHGAVADVVCVPKFSDGSLLTELKSVVNSQSDHWKGIGVYQVSGTSAQVVGGRPQPTAIVASKNAQVKAENMIAVWGDVKTAGGDIVSGASVVAALYALNDSKQAGGVPVRTIGNTPLDMVGIVDPYGNAVAMRETDATQLSADGIVTFLNHGGGIYSTWGDHTSAVSNGTAQDERARYDSNMRVLCYLMNRFQKKYRFAIDKPMTLSLRNDIIQEQNDHLEYLKSIGAIIGQAKCEFRATDNTPDSIALGQFVWNIEATVTPPMKYAELGVAFSQAGLSVYYE